MSARVKPGSRRGLTNPVLHTPCFSARRGALYCEDASLESIAKRFGTPLYVYSAGAISHAYASLLLAFGAAKCAPPVICYSVKANSNLSVLRLLAGLGSRFDIVSGGELARLQAAGIDPGRAVFSGVGKSRHEIRMAVRAGILLFNVESAAELAILEEEAARARRRVPAGIRVNPDIEAGGHPHIATGHHRHKFGMDWPEAQRLYRAHRKSRWLEWRGISAHIGSQVLSLRPYEAAVRRMAGWFRELRRQDIPLRYLDLGGGIGIRYTTEKPFSFAAFARALAGATRGLDCTLLLEPGRAMVGNAGVLLMRVLYTKQNHGRRFVVVDAAMNDFMRPALYGALHAITPVHAQPGLPAQRQLADIVGPVCETGDCFARDWPLGAVKSGDLLALWGAGAYGSVEASNYNTRLRPAEVLVRGRQVKLVRRRETMAGLLKAEIF